MGVGGVVDGLVERLTNYIYIFSKK